jgi:hypothetical protein
MRAIAAIALCCILMACGSTSDVPLDITEVRVALIHQLGILATGINREDPMLASQPISERFRMDNNIAVRYHPDGWKTNDEGVGKFREFFSKAFEIHANIDQRLELRDLELTGEVAAARVWNWFVSSRTDRTPPENFTASGWDWLVFELDSGVWRLISWDEAPEPEPEPVIHNGGEGGGT